MWERIRTAIVLLIIVGTAMFATRTITLIIPLFLIITAVSAYEWAKMLPPLFKNPHEFLDTDKPLHQPIKEVNRKHQFLYSALVLKFVLISLWLPKTWAIWWGISAILWVCAIFWVKNFPHKTEQWYGKRLIGIGVTMIVACITAMFFLWRLSPWWLLYVFVLVWCANSGAYFVGRKLGKRKMSPHVSPNKSVEGLYGGLATGCLVVLGVSFGLLKNWSSLAIVLFLGLSLLTIVISVFGDLFESMMKRHAGIKDSGRILPGHGGVLDRIDSQLSAMPIFALGFWALQYFGVVHVA